jgi:hypothetical protein
LVLAPSPTPKTSPCAREAGVGLAVHALPVAWPTFGAVALPIARRPPLRRRPPAARPALLPLRGGLLPRALPASSLAALECREAGQESGVIGLGWTATLPIVGHGPSREGRGALGRVVGAQRLRRVGDA